MGVVLSIDKRDTKDKLIWSKSKEKVERTLQQIRCMTLEKLFNASVLLSTKWDWWCLMVMIQ